MDRDTAVGLIQQDLGFRTDLDSEIVASMQAAQIELEQGDLLPWFLMTSGEVTNGASDYDQITLPTGWLGELEEESGLWLLDASGGDRVRRLERDDLDAIWSYPLPRASNADGTGTPLNYAISGEVIFLGPEIPSEQLYFEYRYLAKATVLTNNVENSWLASAPGVLYNRAGMLIAKSLRDKEASAIFSEKYARAYDAMEKAHYRRLYSGAPQQMRYVHGT